MLQALKPATSKLVMPRSALVMRTISSSALRRSDHHGPPSIFGQGSPAGAVPTDENQATGLERLQLLGRMEGVDVFGMSPPVLTKKGTLEEPVMVPSIIGERTVGCTGFPSESHDVLWLNLRSSKTRRCPECGQAFKLNYHDDGHADHHH